MADIQVFRYLGLLSIPVAVGFKFSWPDGLLAFGILCLLIGFLGVRK